MSPLYQLLRRRGIHVHPERLDSFVREMEGSHLGFSSFGVLVEKQGELALAHLLITDFNEVGAGCLPNFFEGLHATALPGPYVLRNLVGNLIPLTSDFRATKYGKIIYAVLAFDELKVDEVCDIGAPLRERYHERGAGISRCLKLSLTDDVQRVVGMEYQPIPALHNLFPAGIKVRAQASDRELGKELILETTMWQCQRWNHLALTLYHIPRRDICAWLGRRWFHGIPMSDFYISCKVL